MALVTDLLVRDYKLIYDFYRESGNAIPQKSLNENDPQVRITS